MNRSARANMTKINDNFEINYEKMLGKGTFG